MTMTGRLAARIAALGLSVGIVAATALGAQRQSATPPLMIESITGQDSFEFYCASCHGKAGKGDGPMAQALKTRPTDLTVLARRNDGAFPKSHVLEIVTGAGRPIDAHGSGDMPVWGPIFRGLDPSAVRVRQRIDNIVAYIETLQEPSTGPKDLGARLFKTHCATCHGETGHGNGPLADQLRRTPPDLTQFTARNGGVFPTERVYRIVDGRGVPSHGDREMPVWGDAFRTSGDGLSAESVKARIEAIVRYLQAIQQRAA
jgi:mono/diheme cytochrome c family protein